MAVTYCNGGATGGIEKVVDHNGVCWFDARVCATGGITMTASGAMTTALRNEYAKRIKKANWSQLPWITDRWTGVTDATPWLHFKGIVTR